MKMIDVMKRLAALDANNPNIIKEAEGTVSCSSCGDEFKIAGRKDGFSHCKDHAGKKALAENANLAECGPMGVMDAMSEMGQSHTPASVNITAGSGEELSNMLKDIMSLAGIHRVEPEHLGVEPEQMALTAEPVAAVGPMASAGDEMRSVIDKLNPDADDGEMGDEEETDEGQYDNSPQDPRDVPSYKHDAMLNKDMHNQSQSGSPGQGDRFDGKNPKAFPTMEQQLMAEYKEFVSESVREGKQYVINGKQVDTSSLQVDGIDTRDSPDFSDAYLSSGEFTDGSEMSEQELDQFQHMHGELIHELIWNRLHESVGRKSVREGKPSAGMSAKEKSAVVKKAKAGKDIGKPGKGFEKVAAKAAKEYGSKEKGQKVAAAAMWKNAAKK